MTATCATTLHIMTTEPLDFLSRQFARFLKGEGKADRTRHLYVETLKFYTQWLRRAGDFRRLVGVSKPNVEDWLGDLRDRKLADSPSRIAGGPCTVSPAGVSLKRFWTPTRSSGSAWTGQSLPRWPC